jgi:methionyl-tRNA formyltransferase
LLGAGALLEALQQIATGAAQAVPQPQDGVTYAAKLAKDEARIDWSRPAAEIALQVRAFNPWPMAETRFGGEQLRIHRAHVAQHETGALANEPAATDTAAADPKAAGRILGLDAAGALRVACGQGVLALEVLQRQGRRAVGAREFANGCRVDGAQLQ